MNDILQELINGSTIILERDKLYEFWQFTMSLKDYYSFRYAYQETTVSIILTGI